MKGMLSLLRCANFISMTSVNSHNNGSGLVTFIYPILWMIKQRPREIKEFALNKAISAGNEIKT